MKRLLHSSIIMFLIILLFYCTPIIIDETENESVGTIFINEFMASNASQGIDPYYKNYYDWIEIYNDSDRLIDISNHYLTDNINNPKKWPLSDGIYIEPKGYFIFYPSGDDEKYDHTNFKLSKDGEEIALFNSLGVLVDHIEFGPQTTDVSYGRKPDGGSSWYYFFTPTMKSSNNTNEALTNKSLSPPEFSTKGGFYASTQIVELNIPYSGSPDYRIRYTLDGSFPTETSDLYISPIEVNKTTVIQARTYEDGYLPSRSICNTFLIDENISLPVVSISTDKKNLFDLDIGIYSLGRNPNPEYPFYNANFWHDWERIANIEYINSSGVQELSHLAGIQIYGGDSKALGQKSFSFYARNRYGSDYFNYKFFENKELNRFKRLILRNSGQDWSSTLIRDGLIQSLLIGRMDIDYQSYKPSLVFLNGEFWGIYNIREKMDDNFIMDNYQIDETEMDLLTYSDKDIEVIRGDKTHYVAMLDFIKLNDISNRENYIYLKMQMDVDQFINYYIAQICIGNSDWPGGNIKFWRQRSAAGKWRWMLYDTDFGFGLYASHSKDMIKQVLEKDGIDWPNPAFSTYLFIRLLDNDEFKNTFLQRIAAHLNTTFATARVQGFIDTFKNRISLEMNRQIDRWGGTPGWRDVFYPENITVWENNLEVMYRYAVRRPYYVRQHVIEHFGLKGSNEFTINVYPPVGGKIFINDVLFPVGNTMGLYFTNIPINLKAVPNDGYELVKWETVSGTKVNSDSDSVNISLNTDTIINVIFKKNSYLK